MISPLAILAALAVAQPPAQPRPITVRPSPNVERTLAIETRVAGDDGFVRADRLAEALGGTVSPVGGSRDRVRIRIAGTTFELAAGAPFVRADSVVAALDAAPERDGDRLWLPLQFVTDVLPREARGLLYDTDRRELRAFGEIAAAPARPPRTIPTPEPSAPTVAPTPLPADRSTPPTATRRGHVVVIDAGHGGPDAGMSGPISGGPSVVEKDVTLGIAQQLREALKTRGVTVVMTRTRDTLIALADRGRIANQQHGELFVSIHVNAANPSWRDAAGARGFETYFLADAKSEDARQVAARENESVRFETATPNNREDPLGFILSDMAQNEHLRESSRLATLVQRRMIKAHPGPSRGVKQAGFKVLVTASMPAVLVEVGYGSNGDDAAFMTSAAGQRAIAAAIADAAVEYLGRSERTGTGGGQP